MKEREETRELSSGANVTGRGSADGSSPDGPQPERTSATSESKGETKEQKTYKSSTQATGTQAKQGGQSSSKSKQQGKSQEQGQQGKSRQQGQQGKFQQQGQQGKSQQQGQQGQQKQQEQQGTPLPEWIVFGVSLTLVAVVVIALTYLHFTGESGPPEIRIVPQVEEVEQKEAGYYLPVDVMNVGGETAEDVSITLTLTPPQGQPESKTYSIRFLSPREIDRSTVVFQSDPGQGSLQHVFSFSNP